MTARAGAAIGSAMDWTPPALLALAAALAPAAALAQDRAPEPPVIVVTGQGLGPTPATPAYGTQVIGREQIVASASGRIEDVLSSVAGFQQFRRADSRSANPSAQGVTLRALGGNATSRALVLLDGVPLADPFFGYVPLWAVAPEQLGSIRVTRGGGSGPFGAGALAGTIELDSADPATLGLLSGQGLANQRGETELSATAAPIVGQGFAVLGGRWDRGQGFHTAPRDQRVPASTRARFDSWSASARLVQPVAPDHELQLRALAFDDRRTLRFAGADSSSEAQDVSARLVGRGRWQVDALAYVQWRNFTNVVISSTRFTPVLDQRDTPSTGLGGKLELRPPVGGGHVLRLGADLRRAEGELFEDAYNAVTGARTEQRNAGGTTSDWGLFVEDDWRLGALVLTGGLRADRTRIADGFYRARDGGGALVEDIAYPDRADWTLSWRGGALYALGPALRLRAAAYRGLRLPTLNELYRPFVVFPVVTQANAALENERLEGIEAGADWQPAPGLSLSLTAFDNRIAGAIANVALAPDLRQRRNLEAIDSRGIELAGALERGAWSLDASLAYSDARQRGSGAAAALDGFRPAQTPRWAGSATLAWQPAPGARLAATLRHVGDQFEGDRQDDVLPAATTIDLFAQAPLAGRLAAVIRVENLFDERIVTRNQGGSIDLGAPLTGWAGLRYGF